MNFLSWFMNLVSVAICTQIAPIASPQQAEMYEGHDITEVQVLDANNNLSKKHILLQKLTSDFKVKFEAKKKTGEYDYSGGVNVPLAYELPYSTPVLDQGQYGTCVTFATTSAVQAALHLGDVISQQCTLELILGQGDNLWNGAYYSSEVIDPLKAHGAVSKAKCPTPYPNSYSTIQLEAYNSLIDESITVKQVQYIYHHKISVDEVKLALNHGHYVTIGFGLLNSGDAISVQGFDVKVNGKKYAGGLWACKQGKSKSYCGTPQAGHEIAIYGYDDQQRLFRVRNSWSSGAGYKGDFFLSYEFFSAMTFDGTEIY